MWRHRRLALELSTMSPYQKYVDLARRTVEAELMKMRGGILDMRTAKVRQKQRFDGRLTEEVANSTRARSPAMVFVLAPDSKQSESCQVLPWTSGGRNKRQKEAEFCSSVAVTESDGFTEVRTKAFTRREKAKARAAQRRDEARRCPLLQIKWNYRRSSDKDSCEVS
ncbi:hypothetical protein J6590_064924 [Homalodisca vitripennis]|nr:hypothetical protein J6590_064924 [Homalodisca vitripennis]